MNGDDYYATTISIKKEHWRKVSELISDGRVKSLSEAVEKALEKWLSPEK